MTKIGKASLYRLLDLSIKAAIVIALTMAVYNQVLGKENFKELWNDFYQQLMSPAYVHFLVILILLMPVNWGLEVLKWQNFIQGRVPIGFWQLFKGVLAGVSIALFTPNRVGEFGGRVLMVGAKYSWVAIAASVVGSFCQMLILISAGLIGVCYLGGHQLNWDPDVFGLLIFFIGMILLLMLYAYFNIGKILKLGKFLPGQKWLKAIAPKLRMLGEYNNKTLLAGLLLGGLRFSVYSFQYFFALRFYGVQIPLADALAGITSIFLFQTIVPLPPLIGLVARGELALLIWNYFEANEISILGATFTLFVINLCIPAFVGLIYIVKINIFKSLSNEH